MISAIVGEYTINPEVIFYRDHNSIRLLLPSTHETFAISFNTINVLSVFFETEGSRNIDDLLEIYTKDSLESFLEHLIATKILVPSKTEFPFDTLWKDLGVSTWTYHLDSRNVRYAVTEQERLALATEITKTPPPKIYKCSCQTSLSSHTLGKPRIIESARFTDILMNRRTCRNFVDRPIETVTLSTLLFHTSGVIFEMAADPFGTVLLKAAPSQGARHTTEIYGVIRRCEGLEMGLYHYCAQHHSVNRIREANDQFTARALVGQPYFESAAVIFFFSSVVDRAIWKYRTPSTYRSMYVEVGHYCQNLLLTGTAMGLGVFQTAALDEGYVEHMLDIDGCREFIMYCAGVGLEDDAADVVAGQKKSRYVPDGVEPRCSKTFKTLREDTRHAEQDNDEIGEA